MDSSECVCARDGVADKEAVGVGDNLQYCDIEFIRIKRMSNSRAAKILNTVIIYVMAS